MNSKSSIKFFLLFFLLVFASCEDYLDKAPESGLSEEAVFSKYENFMLYFDGIYKGTYTDLTKPTGDATTDGPFNIQCAYPLFWSVGNQKSTWEEMTEIADAGRVLTTHTFKQGNYSQYNFIYTYAGYRPILRAMFMVIRRANMAMEKIDMLRDASNEAINDILGQAYFMRAYAHFMLHKTWGPMPYIEKVLGPDDEWDQVRLSAYDHLAKIAADFDTARIYFEKANLMRRDNPVAGGPGHLSHPNMFRPNGCAAVALKGRALLYAASPLNNSIGQKAWEDAAKANWEAVETALQYGYQLLTPQNYKYNFVGAQYSNEQIWGYYYGTGAYNASTKQWIISGPMAANKTANSPECPTQNAVDKFETKWGDPLNTEADRQAAIALGHYHEQTPYKDRDPRFYIDIMHNTASIPGYGTAQIYYEMVNGTPKYSELLDQTYAGITFTGYYSQKRWGGESTKNRISPAMTDPLIRLAELYLNYAEAANQAYGPNTPAPGAGMTAVEAINVIRGRFAMVPVQSRFTSDKNVFADRIKNERFVELCYEGFHYYFDIRRWKDAPRTMTEGIYGMDIEKLPAGYNKDQYPTGYKYTRILLPAERQSVWKDAMYYFAFDLEDMQRMKNFIPNEYW
jgi:hypothetical protein